MSRRVLLLAAALVSLSACSEHNDPKQRVCVRLADGVVFNGRQGRWGVIAYPDQNGVFQEITAENSHEFQCRRVKAGEKVVEVWP